MKKLILCFGLFCSNEICATRKRGANNTDKQRSENILPSTGAGSIDKNSTRITANEHLQDSNLPDSGADPLPLIADEHREKSNLSDSGAEQILASTGAKTAPEHPDSNPPTSVEQQALNPLSSVAEQILASTGAKTALEHPDSNPPTSVEQQALNPLSSVAEQILASTGAKTALEHPHLVNPPGLVKEEWQQSGDFHTIYSTKNVSRTSEYSQGTASDGSGRSQPTSPKGQTQNTALEGSGQSEHTSPKGQTPKSTLPRGKAQNTASEGGGIRPKPTSPKGQTQNTALEGSGQSEHTSPKGQTPKSTLPRGKAQNTASEGGGIRPKPTSPKGPTSKPILRASKTPEPTPIDNTKSWCKGIGGELLFDATKILKIPYIEVWLGCNANRNYIAPILRLKNYDFLNPIGITLSLQYKKYYNEEHKSLKNVDIKIGLILPGILINSGNQLINDCHVIGEFGGNSFKIIAGYKYLSFSCEIDYCKK